MLPEGFPGGASVAEGATRARTRGTSAKASNSTSRARKVGSSKQRTKAPRLKRSSRRSRSKSRKRTRRHRRGRAVPAYGSRAAYIMDAETGEVLFEKNAASALPVASLTKLMTNIIFLEGDPDLSRVVTVQREDIRGAGKTQLRTGERVSAHDLLYHSLMSSDNAATKTLVRTSGIPADEFLARMNRKASVLGLNNTHFVEFTGLDARNMSSAADMAQLLKYASRQPLVARITSSPEYSYRSSRRMHNLVNSNRLARYGPMEVKSGKTGFIGRSGYCLATWVREGSRDIIAVVLGAPSNPARFNETRRLLQLASSRREIPVGTVLPSISPVPK